ncbi:MAG: ferritin family protein [Chloroflexi bacterium]|nr:ferritin family protein [Chloroflexota bacterium]
MAQTAITEELLKLSVEIEKNGREFYSQIARRARDGDVKDKFSYLADQEHLHEKTFSDMLKRVSAQTSPPKGFSKEDYQFIKDVAASSIFTGERALDALNRKTMTDIEAVELGLGFEKDSILFYSDMRGMLPRDDQPLIDMITHEEKKHLSELHLMKMRALKG